MYVADYLHAVHLLQSSPVPACRLQAESPKGLPKLISQALQSLSLFLSLSRTHTHTHTCTCTDTLKTRAHSHAHAHKRTQVRQEVEELLQGDMASLLQEGEGTTARAGAYASGLTPKRVNAPTPDVQQVKGSARFNLNLWSLLLEGSSKTNGENQ